MSRIGPRYAEHGPLDVRRHAQDPLTSPPPAVEGCSPPAGGSFQVQSQLGIHPRPTVGQPTLGPTEPAWTKACRAVPGSSALFLVRELVGGAGGARAPRAGHRDVHGALHGG